MRTREQIIAELEEINAYLLKGIPSGNMDLMLVMCGMIATYLASTAALVAEAGRLYGAAQKRLHERLAMSGTANQKYFSASMAKHYVATAAVQESYAYEFATRMNAAVTHVSELLRTAISAEKQLLANLNYSGG